LSYVAIDVLFEDNHLLVLNKPADWVVQGAGEDQNNLLEWAAEYIRRKYQKPGKVFLGVVSRLDAPVTGVLPLARTSKCASRLSEQFRNHSAKKIYVAILEQRPKLDQARLEHHLVRREEDTKTRVVSAANPNSKLGILEYRVIGRNEVGYQVEIELISGRKHQIRAQMEAIGCPIVGDKKYGAIHLFPTGIALHCQSVTLEHPTLKEPRTWTGKTPAYWPT
jgi:23S rRNA pseudouridine1911/1915/1917 synthase